MNTSQKRIFASNDELMELLYACGALDERSSRGERRSSIARARTILGNVPRTADEAIALLAAQSPGSLAYRRRRDNQVINSMDALGVHRAAPRR